MNAVILAAGSGTRLRPASGGVPKPLFRLCGLTLLERAVRTARSAGCETFVIVTGHAAERVRGRLDGALGEGVTWIRAAQWSRGNGASLLAAAPALDGDPFLVLMADHVASPDVLKQAVASAGALAGELDRRRALLLVDPRLDRVVDLDEATRVRRADGRVCAIGKGLADFDGVDTGVFVGSGALLRALEEVDRKGGGRGELTLTAAAARLAERGDLLAVPLSRGWWVDVDDARAARAAEKRLLEDACRSGGDGPIARHLNRPLSRRITAWLGRTRLSADAVTGLAFALMAGAACAFGLGHPALGGILAQVSSVVDGSDGELARLRFAARPAGAFLDTVLDRYADAILVAGLAVGAVALGTPTALVGWTAFAALTGLPLSALMKDRLRALGLVAGERRYDPLRDDPRWMRWLPANRDGRCFLVFVLGLAGQPWLALLALAATTHALALSRLTWVMRQGGAGVGP